MSPCVTLAARVRYSTPPLLTQLAVVSSGGLIVRIDGEPVEGWSALQEKIRAHAGQPLTMEVERNDARETLRIVPAVHEETNPIETVKHGRIGISAVPRAAQVTVISPDLPAARAGLHTFDKVVKLDGSPIASWEQLQQQIAARADAVTLDLIRPLPIQAPGGTLWSDKPMTMTLPAPEKAGAYGLEASDLTLFALQPGGAADEAGLRRGDRVLALNGRPALSWSDEVDGAIKAAGTQPMQITVRREAKELNFTVTPHLRKDRDETGVLQDV